MTTLERSSMFVGGSWRPTVDGTFWSLINPANEQELGKAIIGGPGDVEGVVQAARDAFPSWANTPPAERADALERVAARWEARGPEIAKLVTQEMGMPAGLSFFNNVIAPTSVLRYYAGAIRERTDRSTRTPFAFAGETILRSKPVGVVVAIAPWNFPYMLLMSKVAPALAAGCTVIMKPSRENALSGYLLAEIFEESGLPAGVVSLVVGGRDFAEPLIAHRGVDKVAFTGSTKVGRSVGAAVGERLGVVNLELGGKSAAIVLDDADLDLVAAQLPPLSFMNSGQTCFAQTRVIATPGVYDAVVDAFARFAGAQVLGDPLEDSSTMGPLANRAQRDVVQSFIQSGLAEGARLVSGGPEAQVPDRGYFVAPTVLADVDNDSGIAQEEIFGPVVCIIRAKDAADAVRLANDSRYGLAGSVWTRDVEAGLDLADQVETGTIGVNGYVPDLAAPWGGVKESGNGRENGPEAIDSFTRSMTIYRFNTEGS